MGVYNTIMIPCPNCSEPYGAQSKSGPCNMDYFDLKDAPIEVIYDANRHAPYVCDKCRCVFEVDIKNRKAVKLSISPEQVQKDFTDRMNSGDVSRAKTPIEAVIIAMHKENNK